MRKPCLMQPHMKKQESSHLSVPNELIASSANLNSSQGFSQGTKPLRSPMQNMECFAFIPPKLGDQRFRPHYSTSANLLQSGNSSILVEDQLMF